MSHHNILETYQKVLSLHNDMLAAVQSGNSEVFFELITLCNEAIGCIKESNLNRVLSLDEVDNKVAFIQHLLSQDRKILELLNPTLEKYIG